MPAPLNRATYIATHAGHLGNKISVALGTIQPASSPPRRQRDAGGGVRPAFRVAFWQLGQVFTGGYAEWQQDLAGPLPGPYSSWRRIQ